jgi:hypothetical protein
MRSSTDASGEETSSHRNNASSTSSSDRTPPTYGYHNTFHTHAPPIPDVPPPSYAVANSEATLNRLAEKARAERRDNQLPQYTCTVHMGATAGLKQELSTPFQVAGSREWNDVYLSLRGTQLCVHKIKMPNILSKSRWPGPGRLIKSYSLQHAEVGIAADFKRTRLTPKSPFAHLVPTASRQKLYEADPHMFETVREFVLRLRLETEQFLLCAASQEEMLDWLEALCAAIDISSPIEDRSEPRHRTLPRRSRRQRTLDGARIEGDLENLSTLEAGRRIIADQERIMRQLYPHLVADVAGADQPQESSEPTRTLPSNIDPETDDLDPEDVRFPSARRTSVHNGESERRPSSSSTTESSADPKSRLPHGHSASQALRYRRRCAPVLLASSPRVSDVVFTDGRRMRINVKEHILVNFIAQPPRYDAHSYSKQRKIPVVVPKVITHHIPAIRPASPLRGISDDSFLSFGYDLVATPSGNAGASAAYDSDGIRSVPSSGPPSPTIISQTKADAGRKIIVMGKTSREQRTRDDQLSMGVGLLL